MREKVQDYVNAALPAVNLTQWKVRVSNAHPDDDSWADVEVSDNLWEATIRLSEDFFNESPEHQRRILAHELVHIHQAALERIVETLAGTLGSQAYEFLSKLWDTETERVAEGLSFVVAKAMPMPAFAQKKRA